MYTYTCKTITPIKVTDVSSTPSNASLPRTPFPRTRRPAFLSLQIRLQVLGFCVSGIVEDFLLFSLASFAV